MVAPELEPDYLVTVIDTVVASVAEASAMVSTGDVRDLPELFRYANDLLDILSDGMCGSAEALSYVDNLRKMLWAMWNAVDGARSLH